MASSPLILCLCQKTKRRFDLTGNEWAGNKEWLRLWIVFGGVIGYQFMQVIHRYESVRPVHESL
jgi:hypothetical protein